MIIFHIDVNSAFLSWSALDYLNKGHKVDLRAIPSAVGGDPSKRHGIILAKSTPAKKYNITTGEPIYFAKQKCPSLVIVPPNFKFYEKCSRDFYNLLTKYSSDVEQASIDECYLDYTGSQNLFGDHLNFAYKLKDEIKDALGFSVNIGIGENKLLAKIASDFTKPDKVHTLYNNEIKDKLWPLPIRDLMMVGKKSALILEKMRITNIGQIANASPKLIQSKHSFF